MALGPSPEDSFRSTQRSTRSLLRGAARAGERTGTGPGTRQGTAVAHPPAAVRPTLYPRRTTSARPARRGVVSRVAALGGGRLQLFYAPLPGRREPRTPPALRIASRSRHSLHRPIARQPGTSLA